jgi:hypothetical protein
VPVPPLAELVIEPVLLPWQLVPKPLKLDGVTVVVIAGGALIVTEADVAQPLASVTFTV